MTLGTSNRQSRLDHLLRMVLTAALMFAAWHVASHDVDITSDVSGHGECQVCRLNHVPIADMPVLAGLPPLLLVSLVLVVQALPLPTQTGRYTLGARAPPSF